MRRRPCRRLYEGNMREIVLGQVICNGVGLGTIQPFQRYLGRGRAAGVISLMEGSTVVIPVVYQ